MGDEVKREPPTLARIRPERRRARDLPEPFDVVARPRRRLPDGVQAFALGDVARRPAGNDLGWLAGIAFLFLAGAVGATGDVAKTMLFLAAGAGWLLTASRERYRWNHRPGGGAVCALTMWHEPEPVLIRYERSAAPIEVFHRDAIVGGDVIQVDSERVFLELTLHDGAGGTTERTVGPLRTTSTELGDALDAWVARAEATQPTKPPVPAGH